MDVVDRPSPGLTLRASPPSVTVHPRPIPGASPGHGLVLSLFPGIDLFGRAFRAEGWSVVLGPDLEMGTGDIRDFIPSSSFTGIIGGSPCQDFSQLRRDEPTGEGVAMLQEFCRIVQLASPEWWLLENVPRVPDIFIAGYSHQRIDVRACEFGLTQSRLRHFQFGHRSGKVLILERGKRVPAGDRVVTASEGKRKERRSWEDVCKLMGLPEALDLPRMHIKGRYRSLGNGVPYPVGRAFAAAIRDRLCEPTACRVCICGCARVVTGNQKAATPRCRKMMQKRRDRAGLCDSAAVTYAGEVTGDPRGLTPAAAIAESGERAGQIDEGPPSSSAMVAASQIDWTGYPGSKAASGVSERIIREMPPHATYVEGFAGTATVYRVKRRAESNILIEKSPRTHARLSAGLAAVGDPADVRLGDVMRILPTLLAMWDPQTLLYLDPPYLLETRTRLLYEEEFATPEEHTELLTLIASLPCMVMISGYDSALYRQLLSTWRVVTFNAMTRGGPRVEHLWCNFAAPDVLHDPRFAGKDFRERERLNRKKKRWAAKFELLPPTERQVIAEALASCDRTALEAAMRHGHRV